MSSPVKARDPQSFGRVSWWLGVSTWAVVEYAVAAAANFAFNILLARWLDPAQYGAFAAGYALLWLVWGVYKGLLLDPAMVFTTHRFRDHAETYHSSLLTGHALLSIGFIAAFFVVGALAHSLVPGRPELPWFTLAIAGPFLFLPVLLRGLCRARLQTSMGAEAAVLYAVAMLAGLLIAYRVQLLSARAAFGITALAGALSSVWLARRLRLNRDGLWLARRDLVRQIVAEHWRYGRWLIVLSFLSWMPLNIWYTALPLLKGSGETASLRALVNLAQPAIQGYGAMYTVLIPMFVLAKEQQRFQRTLNLMLAASLAGSVAFAVAVGVSARPLILWLYGGRYVEAIPLVWPLMLTMVLFGLNTVQSAAMQGLERADWLTGSYAAAALLILVVGLPATAIWGLSGAVAGQFCAAAALVAVQAWLLRTRASIAA
jgi:O-antigen/teichoic acid export membrane protein